MITASQKLSVADQYLIYTFKKIVSRTTLPPPSSNLNSSRLLLQSVDRICSGLEQPDHLCVCVCVYGLIGLGAHKPLGQVVLTLA